MKTFNLKQLFSRLPIFQRLEMIASTLLKAILKAVFGIFQRLQISLPCNE